MESKVRLNDEKERIMDNSIDEKIKLLKEKMQLEQEEIIRHLNNEKLFSEKDYKNQEALKEINRLSNVLLNQKLWKKKQRNLYALSNYIDKNRDSYEKINKIINFSKNINFYKLKDLIKDAASYQVTLKSGDDGEKETERMIMLFSDKVKYARGLRVGIEDELSGKMIHAENDFIVIGENGVFSLEVKTNSRDRVVTENGNFIDKYSNDKSGSNIVEQCMLHENVVRRVLEEELFKRFSKKEEVEVHSVIISANNAINVENRSNRFKVLLKNEIQNYILNDFKPVRKLTKEEIELYFNILKDRDVGEAEFSHNIKINEIIEQISAYMVIDKNYDTIRNILIQKREEKIKLEQEEAERIELENKAEAARLEKEKQEKRISEERAQTAKKIKRIIASVMAVVVIILALKAVKVFIEYKSDVRYSKNNGDIFKDNIEAAIDGDGEAIGNIISNLNNYSVEEYEAIGFINLLKEDEDLKKKILKSLDKKVTKERKVNDFISIGSNNRLLLKESNLSIDTNINDLSPNCIFNINGEIVEFNNELQLLPGVYDIKAMDIVYRAETEGVTEMITDDKSIDLSFNNPVKGELIDVNVIANVDKAQILINGQKTNYYLYEGSVLIPALMKDNSKISVKYSMPWGEVLTDEVLITGSQAEINLKLDNESAKVNEIINRLKEEYKDCAGDDEELSLTLYMNDLEFTILEDQKLSITIWSEFERNYVSFGMLYGIFENKNEVIISADGTIENIYISKNSLPGYLNSDGMKVIKYSDKSKR